MFLDIRDRSQDLLANSRRFKDKSRWVHLQAKYKQYIPLIVFGFIVILFMIWKFWF